MNNKIHLAIALSTMLLASGISYADTQLMEQPNVVTTPAPVDQTYPSRNPKQAPVGPPNVMAEPTRIPAENKIPAVNKIPKPNSIPGINKVPAPNKIPQPNAIPNTQTIINSD
jgi:hypothetical protein